MIFGIILQIHSCSCCCKGINYEILPRHENNIPKYYLKTNGCKCSVCCFNLCCCLHEETIFQIYNTTTNLFHGQIDKKYFRWFNRFDFLNYNINFPNDVLPEEKILIVTQLVLIMLYISQLGMIYMCKII